MSLDKEARRKIREKHQTHERDTGSPQAQIAVISARLISLNDHFTKHVKDHASRYGLMKLVGKRRRLLNYLQNQNPSAYKKLIVDLDIRK